LIEDIASGKHPVGSLLPTEFELSARHGVSRQTVRQALQRLGELGLVTRQRGVGTRVQRARAVSSHSYSMDSMSDLSEYARDARLVIDSSQRLEARGKTAKFLECRDGTRWVRILGRRLHCGEQTPVAVSDIFLRAVYSGIEARLGTIALPMHKILEQDYGEIVETIRQDIRAVSIGSDDARVLEVDPGSPGMEVVRRYYGGDGRLLIAGRVLHPAERFSYTMHFRREPPR
jgi:DNA-binding GntR family transcriptional regulator